jgi:hypothetical protein
MTADTFQSGFAPKAFDRIPTMGISRLIPVAFHFLGYALVFMGYIFVFLISFMTVGFLEIRQANMEDFNALIAVLEQRDRYTDRDYLDKQVQRLRDQIDSYGVKIGSLDCPKGVSPNATKPAPDKPGGDQGASNANPKTCAEAKEAAWQHYVDLLFAYDAARFRSANLSFYYDQYKDGITQKTPQIIPALRLLDSGPPWLKLWARSPFELIEMFLLVFMGMLGGAISVMRCLFDPSLKTPTIAEFFYRPAAGAAISIGVYVLFRAAQIFLGVQSQGSAATVSTSVFLLAGLGLASGFSAKEALGQIDFAATRLLRTAGRGANSDTADSSRGSAAEAGADHNSGPTVTAGSPR